MTEWIVPREARLQCTTIHFYSSFIHLSHKGFLRAYLKDLKLPILVKVQVSNRIVAKGVTRIRIRNCNANKRWEEEMQHTGREL